MNMVLVWYAVCMLYVDAQAKIIAWFMILTISEQIKKIWNSFRFFPLDKCCSNFYFSLTGICHGFFIWFICILLSDKHFIHLYRYCAYFDSIDSQFENSKVNNDCFYHEKHRFNRFSITIIYDQTHIWTNVNHTFESPTKCILCVQFFLPMYSFYHEQNNKKLRHINARVVRTESIQL